MTTHLESLDAHRRALRSRLISVHQSFQLWQLLRSHLDLDEPSTEPTEHVVVHRYPKFFSPVLNALEHHMIVALAAIMDSGGQVSLTKLLHKIESNASSNRPHPEAPRTFTETRTDLAINVASLKTIRDKYFAHLDKNILKGPVDYSVTEYQEILDAATRAFNDMNFQLSDGFVHAPLAGQTSRGQLESLLKALHKSG